MFFWNMYCYLWLEDFLHEIKNLISIWKPWISQWRECTHVKLALVTIIWHMKFWHRYLRLKVAILDSLFQLTFGIETTQLKWQLVFENDQHLSHTLSNSVALFFRGVWYRVVGLFLRSTQILGLLNSGCPIWHHLMLWKRKYKRFISLLQIFASHE